jgi:hypothetical protein
MVSDVDEWIPKHFDDSLAYPSVTSAASFAVPWGLPASFTSPGCRIIIYVAEDMPGLVAWLDSPELRAAIEDGADREAQVIPVDGDPFTGNIYAAEELAGSAGSDFVPGGGIFIERFEVPEGDSVEFDDWLAGHLRAVAQWPGVARVRTWVQNRDVPAEFPYDRYRSKGNRMLSADFSPDAKVADLLAIDEVWASMADSAQWDLRLPYVRREAGRPLMIRTA